MTLASVAAFFALTAGSLSLGVDENVPETDLAVASSADVVIDVVDSPPSYADSTTGLPVSVVLSGQTVQWNWEGGLFHSVTTDADLSVGSEGFDSGQQRLEDDEPFSFEQTFTEPGVYKVFCQVHPDIQHGVVVVV